MSGAQDHAAAAADAVQQLTLTARKARMRCFSEIAPDATVHFQILDLGQQLFVWVAVGGAKFQNLYLAIQNRLDPNPSIATLLPDGASSGAASMAQRLALRTGRPVICSCNLPPNADMLQVVAERRLCQELDSMGLTSSSSSSANSRADTPAATQAPALDAS
eukprot:GHUV01008295.1.p1 GENE.GHUV01008295.1~~GHUV01008295.1.p1  ORF type:complete len:162 (+),score=52.51 GHUV01008295.1:149-634(+)